MFIRIRCTNSGDKTPQALMSLGTSISLEAKKRRPQLPQTRHQMSKLFLMLLSPRQVLEHHKKTFQSHRAMASNFSHLFARICHMAIYVLILTHLIYRNSMRSLSRNTTTLNCPNTMTFLISSTTDSLSKISIGPTR